MDANAFARGFLEEFDKIALMRRPAGPGLLARGVGAMGQGVGAAGKFGLRHLGPAALLGGLLAAPIIRAGVQGTVGGLREPATGHQMPYQQ